jgi:hypothetical protein
VSLRAEQSNGRVNEQAERRPLRIIVVTFFLLAAYVIAARLLLSSPGIACRMRDQDSNRRPENQPALA